MTIAESASAAWGGYKNGQIPTSALRAIPWKPSDYLRRDAVEALVALNVAFVQQFGYNLPVSSAYRDYAGQVYWRNYWCSQGNCGNAAAPGTSNHGWAVAIDIGVPITGWTHPIYLWMKANAPKWGWVHPAWAEPGGSGPDEAWHWEYTGAYTSNPSEMEDPVPTHQSTAFAPNLAVPANVWTAVPVSGAQLYLATVGSGSVETGDIVINLKASGLTTALQVRLVAELLSSNAGSVVSTAVQPATEISASAVAGSPTHGQHVQAYQLGGPMRFFVQVMPLNNGVKIDGIWVKKNFWSS